MAGKFVVALTLMSAVGYALAAQAGLELTITGYDEDVGEAAGGSLQFKGPGVIVSGGEANVVVKQENGYEVSCNKKTAMGNAETLAKIVAFLGSGVFSDRLYDYCDFCRDPNANCNDPNSGCQFNEDNDEPTCVCNKGFQQNMNPEHNPNGYDVACREITWFDYTGSSENKFKCWRDFEGGRILKDGKKAKCDPIGKYKKLGHDLYELNEAEGVDFPCCSRSGWCGNTPDHCCDTCYDYSKDWLPDTGDVVRWTAEGEPIVMS